MEIIEDHAGDTYRAVYTVFQKKSKAGIKTPKPEIDVDQITSQDEPKKNTPDG